MTNSKFKLNLNNSSVNSDLQGYEEKIEKIQNTPTPRFAKYTPDLEKLKVLREKYQDKKNIIVEGNGGAISNFRGIYSALKNMSDKNVFLLDTEDPDYIAELRNKCKKEDTLVILTSKSGTRIQVLANYFAFADYPLLVITEDNDGTLNQIRKIKNLNVSFYPEVEITDRFTGLTESALTTAEIVGIDTEEMIKGGKEIYSLCDINRGFHSGDSPVDPKMQDSTHAVPQPCGTMEPSIEGNPALQLAITLDKLENLGYTDLFLSIYSKKLSGFFELIVQLFHESVCKNGLGQTIYGGEAPENQHHTLQRLISGRKNSVGLFLTVENFSNKEAKIEIEKDLKNIACRNLNLEDLNNISLEEIIKAEFQGTWQDVIDNKIPAINFELEEVSPRTIGQFMAFFQYVTFYSALLREVNPCNQPGVEKSKENIFGIVGEIGE
ncbi:MAG: hypothetical protein KAI57_01995 [Candidatus Pacebacteria bacterium]|nr:hypothetical protein [Candidatus Paceibacterota bacterium]